MNLRKMFSFCRNEKENLLQSALKRESKRIFAQFVVSHRDTPGIQENKFISVSNLSLELISIINCDTSRYYLDGESRSSEI